MWGRGVGLEEVGLESGLEMYSQGVNRGKKSMFEGKRVPVCKTQCRQGCVALLWFYGRFLKLSQVDTQMTRLSLRVAQAGEP